ncbi:unnamed protein product, partial [Staurois parvus]
ANQCHPSVLPISVAYQCQSVPPNSVSQCCLSCVMYQCCLSVPIVMPVNAHQCNLPVPISATYQCPSVQPISAHHCSLISAHQ